MKKLLYLFLAMFITIGLNACSPDDNPIDDSDTETPENPNPDEPDDPDTPEPTSERRLSSITASRIMYIPLSTTWAHKSKPM